MTASQKQCPRCGTLAPLDATFCGQCGRQYRTQFVPQDGSAGGAFADPGAPYAAPAPAFAPRTPSVWILRVVQGTIAAVVCFGILAYSGFFRHDTRSAAPAVVTAPTTHPSSAEAPVDQKTAARRALSDDPIEAEARRAVDRESQKLNLTPQVSQDGKIHLRSGGTISKEEWDAASRKVQNSPAMREPPLPPPF